MAWTRGQTIGRGSFATVSIATVHGSGQVLAVKSTELTQSEFLQREQKTLSTLNCPQIVAYKGCDITLENGRLLYNVLMEYAPHGTLADSIHNQGGCLDEASIQAFTRSIVLGLQCLHSNGIVHCDIKCHNILVTHEGVKIADLGCARRLDDVSDDDLVIAGTPVFMAPEVARGEKQGFPADVWALGCTMIEMATGRSPWPEISDPVSALYRIGYSGDVPEVPSLMSKQAKDFLDKCLKRDPVERWSASELLSHAFLEETISLSKEVSVFNSDTPTSVLHQGFWDPIGEVDATNPTSKIPLSSPRERIRQLSEISTASSQRMPDWVWDEHWITVRSNSSKQPEMFYSSQEYDLFYANELSTTAGGICQSWVGQGKEWVHFNEPTRTGGKESCNISNTNSNYSSNSSNVIGMWRGVRRRRSLIWPMNVKRMPLNVIWIALWGKNNMDIFFCKNTLLFLSFLIDFRTV
ncbi:mitogen-activated protein kinase kinase kinase 18-like [Carya illinoinensis]|uniref:Protein kinase domain-containing protein n=1 Tax=Carya illinoinensis TaxID=32201 RepID=A0A8T1PIW6_CARIL|nr:mitogen-activated protein kinase kinase kinase 18-like [Carya illinoinensis]KAG6641734.1 hypothetical protein CIPAW_09G095200 [Carya illinoinensis]